MSNTIPYDPDDFDNNPFAEPTYPPLLTGTQDSQPRATTTTDIAHDALYHNSPEPYYSEDLSTSNTHTLEATNSGENKSSDQSTTAVKSISIASSKPTEEDIELLPERFDGRQSEYQIAIKVTGLERYGSLSNKRENPNILFDVQTNIKSYKSKSYKSVKKSYLEFQTFFKLLNESVTEVFVESIPPSMTNYGISNERDYFKTVKWFQDWFNGIISNPILQRLPELQYFIESDYNSYKPISKLSQTAKGLKRKTLKQLAPPYDECLELAEFRPLIKSLHRDCKSIHETLERTVRLKRSVGAAEAEMGQKIAELKPLEIGHSGMAKLWDSFGKTICMVGDFDTVLGSLEYASLGDGIEKLVQDTYIIKESLTDRHLLMRELITAQQNTKIKHEAASRLRNKRDINPIKVNDAIEALNEAIQEESDLTKKVQRVTKEMLIEKAQIMERLDSQVKDIFKELLISKIEYERKKLMALERIKLNVRSVDANGGLSRLGRENFPRQDVRKSIKPSQGANGDAWSGIKRTYDPKLAMKVEAYESLYTSAKSLNVDQEGQGDQDGNEEKEEEEQGEENQMTARKAAS
ncbi:hypothetical protein WICPIJ_007420, partial [Wickerhamomyces pijperi]